MRQAAGGPSSVNDRLPGGHWGATWLLTASLAGALLGGFELRLRAAGVTPTVSDDAALWCRARARVRDADPAQTVVVGTSRIRLALDTDTWAECFGGRQPILLAVNASTPFPVLDDLARATGFNGLVVCDVSPAFFFRGVDFPLDPSREYVEKFRTFGLAAGVEEELRVTVQEHLVLRRPRLALTRLLADLVSGNPLVPTASQRHVRRDRSTYADFNRQDLAELSRARAKEAVAQGVGVPPERLQRDIAAINAMVHRIQSRGGQVVFVRLPTSGAVRAVEDVNFPRQRYWDVFAAHTPALAVCCNDVPELASFKCPEGSHLDSRDAPAFTRALARIIRQKLEAVDRPTPGAPPSNPA